MKTIFNEKYNRENYLDFLQNYLLPDDFQNKEEIVTDDLSFKPNKINKITYLGNSDKLGIAVYEMKHKSEYDPRVTLSREAFKIMANFSKRRALVFFVSENADNYRFSLITIDLKLEGKKITKLFSNPRRYSFLLGEQAKIGTLHDKLLKSRRMEATERVEDFEDLLNRFSVESVSKQFFTEYKRLFEYIKKIFGDIPTLKILISKDENLNIDIFSRKLLGQIVFIYFMQRKKWLGGNPQNENWDDGKQNFLRWAFDYCTKNDLNFYEHFLESLFYNGLNETDAAFEFNGMYIKVPYLNGGLFEQFYEKDETIVFYPTNGLFSNSDESGILDVFDRYNFTIDENTFFEQDVAIDPEMLGKVFENLLDENLRKGKGAFYTPREIVSYMTKESLKNYLKNAVQTSEVSLKIDHLFEYKDLYIENTKTELEEYGEEFETQFYEMLDIVEEVNELLKNIKTVDPAIGSGAFSIGLLHEIVSLRQYIEDQFLNNKISNYTLKKETIQNNIYGVDIDNGAVEIAKLRFWLSLVVDANVPEALPNLDYKIMQGNSLIESFGGININQIDSKINDDLNEKKELGKERDEILDKINQNSVEMSELNQNALLNATKIDAEKNRELLQLHNNLVKEKNKITKKIKKIAESLPSNKIRVEEDTQIEHLHELQCELYNCKDKYHKVDLRDEIENTIVKIFHSKIELEKNEYFKTEQKMMEIANRFPTNEQRKQYLENETKELKKKFNFDYLALEQQLHEFTKKDKIRPFFPWHLYFADVFANTPLRKTSEHPSTRREYNTPKNFVFHPSTRGEYNTPKNFVFHPSTRGELKGGFDIVIGNPPYIQLQKFSGQQIQKDYEAQNFESFAKTGDIYGLFYEKGNMLLKENGILTFITSNKWMRANYGKKLRKYFTEKTQPIQLIDFGGYKVFESATVDTNILIFKNSPLIEGCHEVAGCLACTIRKGFTRETDIVEYVKENGIELSNLSEESWIISTKEEFAIKQKIEKIGTPLKDWDVSIYRGVLTGFNEAFIISEAKKDELIAADPKSAEIIKPILRGRDIKRYKAEFADLWLIATHNGFKDIEENKIPRIDVKDFPAIKEHLDKYWDKISKRYDKGATPYNLRNCAYYEEFEKEKIVYNDISQKLTFALCEKGFYFNNTVYFVAKSVFNKYFIGLLNTKIIDWYYRRISVQLGKKAVRLFSIYVKQLPIPNISKENQKPFENLVNQILQKKEQNNSPLQRGGSEADGVLNSSLAAKSDGVFRNYKNLPYNPKLKQRARELRKAGNLSEVLFWNQVKQRQFLGLDFHRQKIIGNYIVDFYCSALDLVIEIDGSSHNDKVEYDKKRDNYLKSVGLEIKHFLDADIKQNLNSVMEDLKDCCSSLLSNKNTPRLKPHPSSEGNENTPSLRDTPLREGNENTPSLRDTPLREGNDTTHLENQIDLMVYKLYELSYEEVKIVDAEIDCKGNFILVQKRQFILVQYFLIFPKLFVDACIFFDIINYY